MHWPKAKSYLNNNQSTNFVYLQLNKKQLLVIYILASQDTRSPKAVSETFVLFQGQPGFEVRTKTN